MSKKPRNPWANQFPINSTQKSENSKINLLNQGNLLGAQLSNNQQGQSIGNQQNLFNNSSKFSTNSFNAIQSNTINRNQFIKEAPKNPFVTNTPQNPFVNKLNKFENITNISLPYSNTPANLNKSPNQSRFYSNQSNESSKVKTGQQKNGNIIDDDYDYDAILSDSDNEFVSVTKNQTSIKTETTANTIVNLVDDDYDYDAILGDEEDEFVDSNSKQNIQDSIKPESSVNTVINLVDDDYDYDAILGDSDDEFVNAKDNQGIQTNIKYEADRNKAVDIVDSSKISGCGGVDNEKISKGINQNLQSHINQGQNPSGSTPINIVDLDYDFDALFSDNDEVPQTLTNDVNTGTKDSDQAQLPQPNTLNQTAKGTIVDDDYDFDQLFESEDDGEGFGEDYGQSDSLGATNGLEVNRPNQPSNSTNNWFQQPSNPINRNIPLPSISVQTTSVRPNNFFRLSGFTTTKEIAPPQFCYEDKFNLPPLPHDPEAIKSWVYPINYPLREYQYNIVQKALYYNTLVALPTGLGKTFIAAVVMFNYYRWFPKLKVVFMAPTKPLVNQQIEACYNICGIPQNDSIEITGAMKPSDRRLAWQTKRVFYITPHVLNNDLKSGVCSAKDFSCVVVDEAHRAIGEYASAQSVQQLYHINPLIRVLALSATPGSTMDKVKMVICNLFISCVEFRQENSPDIQPYTFDKISEEVVVSLSPLITRFEQGFRSLMAPFLEKLHKNRALNTDDVNSVHRYNLLQARLKFRSVALDRPRYLKNQIEGYFAICFSLCMYIETLTKYGLTSFYSQILGLRDSTDYSLYRNECIQNPNFIRMVEELGQIISAPNYLTSMQSHPKLSTLYRYVSEYFDTTNKPDGTKNTSKVMIFAQFREPVEEIVNTLKLNPSILPAAFIGRGTSKVGKGLKMKEQAEVINKFKRGEYNVLVCTSIGEEGLDIGEVDLIVCYDSNSSPIRLLQRIGRTGRRRHGKVCMLLTEGKEVRAFHNSKQTHKSILNSISENSMDLYGENPRMLPKGTIPSCIKKHIEVAKYVDPTETKRKRKVSKLDPTSSFRLDHSQKLHYLQIFGPTNKVKLQLNKFPTKQLNPNPTFQVPHSKRTLGFIKLMNSFQQLKLMPEDTNSQPDALNATKRVNGIHSELDRLELDTQLIKESSSIAFNHDFDFDLNFGTQLEPHKPKPKGKIDIEPNDLIDESGELFDLDAFFNSALQLPQAELPPKQASADQLLPDLNLSFKDYHHEPEVNPTTTTYSSSQPEKEFSTKAEAKFSKRDLQGRVEDYILRLQTLKENS